MLIVRRILRLLRRSFSRLKHSLLSEEYEMLRYAIHEAEETRGLLRYVLPTCQEYQEFVRQTNASFEYQWEHLNAGSNLLSDHEFQGTAVATVERYTGLPRSWFSNRKILDAGCGSGRWSWALCRCGAEVTAMDQSASAVAAAQEACAGFSGFQARQHDLLEPMGMARAFDMVWSYGVVHHTGNTPLAIRNIADCVKPGGYLFLMVYGVPRWNHPEDFIEVNQYHALRQQLALMSFDDRVSFLRQNRPEALVHAWFDALSPRINDLHRVEEITEWLALLGFSDVRLTVASRNLHVMACRS